MSKHIKSIAWSILLVVTYMVLQLIIAKAMGNGIFHFEPDYSDPKTWRGAIILREVNTSLMMVVPIIISMLICYILYKLVFKEKMTANCGFSKAGAKNIFIGILIGFFISLLYLLILNNSAWNELIYNKGLLNLYKLFIIQDALVMIRNTIFINIISIITMVVVVPFFEEILFRGLVFNKLRAVMPVWVAIVLQALLFGIIKGNVTSAICAFIIGLLLGIIFMVTKSIWLPVLIHAILNISTMLIKGFDEISILLGISRFDTTENIDTFVYNSITGGTQNVKTTGMPIMLNTLLAVIMLLSIIFLIIWLWKSNKLMSIKDFKSKDCL